MCVKYKLGNKHTNHKALDRDITEDPRVHDCALYALSNNLIVLDNPLSVPNRNLSWLIFSKFNNLYHSHALGAEQIKI